MNFPNAQKGISKIIIASIISIVATTIIDVFVFAQDLALAVPKTPANNAANAAANAAAQVNPDTDTAKHLGYIVIVGIVIMVAACVIKIIGLWQAGQDEKFFKYALYTLALSICGNFFVRLIPDNQLHTREYVYCAFTLVALVYTIFIIQGVIGLAKKKNNAVMEKKSVFIFELMTVLYILMLVLKVVSVVVRDTAEKGTKLAIEVGYVLISVIAFFIILSLLLNAKKMLTEQNGQE